MNGGRTARADIFMKHTRLKTLIATILLAAVSTTAGACSAFPLIKDYEEYTHGDLVFIVVDNYGVQTKEKAVAIVGLTNSGKQKESVFIPSEIAGDPVRFIGYRYKTSFSAKYYEIESDALKKLYIPESIDRIYGDSIVKIGSADRKVSLMLCSANDPLSCFYHTIGGYDYYFYEEVYNGYPEAASYHKANVVFKNNYSDEINGGYYSLDNIDEGEKIPLPPDPKREGFSFVGWYTEPECVNKWNFDLSPTIKDGEEFALYAGWRAL